MGSSTSFSTTWYIPSTPEKNIDFPINSISKKISLTELVLPPSCDPAPLALLELLPVAGEANSIDVLVLFYRKIQMQINFKCRKYCSTSSKSSSVTRMAKSFCRFFGTYSGCLMILVTFLSWYGFGSPFVWVSHSPQRTLEYRPDDNLGEMLCYCNWREAKRPPPRCFFYSSRCWCCCSLFSLPLLISAAGLVGVACFIYDFITCPRNAPR